MQFKFLLVVGTILMIIVMLCIRRYYSIVRWKIVIASVLLTLSGVICARFMFWLETSRWGGVSFFGAIFFTPLLMMLMALSLKIPIGAMLDMCAPAECVMLAQLKINCFYDGCCGGRVLYTTESATVYFPSQIVEMVNALCLLVILLMCIKKRNYQNEVFPLYMILYGITRFILNLFRDTEPFVFGLPAGNFWSLISIAIGLVCIYTLRKQKNKLINDSNDN